MNKALTPKYWIQKNFFAPFGFFLSWWWYGVDWNLELQLIVTQRYLWNKVASFQEIHSM